ncbi:MAG: hypothetical protein BTN85_1440 [Candidatus Methanohalarchaeum thermophilum]|uniref:Uncharacterized protein n=1 Tax=Methanohalarchaeum thermophilum TaxID=1903181 RepID=A0A1Q6DX44_METT1|nr:MAG: hypothetical protein BTN85_1440 [Candidatus Methanohalarchaeum thermophilum]
MDDMDGWKKETSKSLDLKDEEPKKSS